MSFQDLEAATPQQQRQPIYSNSIQKQRQRAAYQYQDQDQSQNLYEPSQAVSAGIFQINTAVSSFFRLVNSLGTPRDTLQLRDKLHKSRAHIGELVKDTSAKLKQASETDQHAQVSVVKKIADAKLAKDFQAVLKEFQKAQRLAAERETTFAPFVPKDVLPTSYLAHEQEMSSTTSSKQQALLLESRRWANKYTSINWQLFAVTIENVFAASCYGMPARDPGVGLCWLSQPKSN
ncbi:PREDICTED: syntaxin-22 [Prunus dulcis]|uniref:PREDICTED: syntaxin-22 n=1 Tax=Prunus dulcis TaxID=3755 RepID=A0A5E4E888_PRUDU|nr:PREDICTED: syntaxin-22 [Prunus dulcis]